MLDSNQIVRPVIYAHSLDFIVFLGGWVRTYFTVFHD